MQDLESKAFGMKYSTLIFVLKSSFILLYYKKEKVPLDLLCTPFGVRQVIFSFISPITVNQGPCSCFITECCISGNSNQQLCGRKSNVHRSIRNQNVALLSNGEDSTFRAGV